MPGEGMCEAPARPHLRVHVLPNLPGTPYGEALGLQGLSLLVPQFQESTPLAEVPGVSL